MLPFTKKQPHNQPQHPQYMESNPYTSPSANLFGSTGSEMEAVPQDVITPLVRTRFWVRLISVVLWVSAVLMLLGGLGMGIATAAGMSAASAEGANGAMKAGMVIGVCSVYVVLSFFYIFPAMKLWAYGSQIADLAASRSAVDLMKAMNTQRSFWKFVGVMTLISLILAFVAIAGSIALGAAGAMGALPTGSEL